MKIPDAHAVHDGVLYVRTNQSGIPPLCLVVDGVAIHFWSDENRKPGKTYVSIRDAIAWHEQEMRKNKRWKVTGEKALAVHRAAQADAEKRYEVTPL